MEDNAEPLNIVRRWSRWEDIADALAGVDAPFGCLFVSDATGVPAEVVGRAMLALQRVGCHYIATWGPDCERVHDIFDEEFVMENLDNISSAPVVCSSWHDKDSLLEAIWFTLSCVPGFGEDVGGMKTLLFLCEDREGWLAEIEGALADPDGLFDRLEDEE